MNEIEERLNQAVIDATKDMFQTIMGGEISCNGIKKGKADISDFDINVVIAFAGEESGVFIMQCPKIFGIEAANKMLGMEVAEDSDEMKDAVSEFMNMIVGKAKSNYSADRETFKVSIPTIIIGKDFVVYTKKLDYNRESTIDFSYNSYNIILNVFLK